MGGSVRGVIVTGGTVFGGMCPGESFRGGNVSGGNVLDSWPVTQPMVSRVATFCQNVNK